MMRKQWILLALIAAVTACEKTVPDSELVAKVNGEGITKKAFDAQVERNMARYRGQGHALPPGIETRIKESVLRRMIDDEIIRQKARELGLTVSDEELNAKFKEHKDRFRTDKAFQDYLERSNNTEDNMKKDLRRNMLRDRVVEKMSGSIDVTDEDVEQYYEENKHRFKEKEQVKISRILIRSPQNAPEAEKKEAQKKAEDIESQIDKGEDFAELAREHSEGPEKTRRGELGWMTRGRMPPEFDNAAFNLEPGAVSDVVPTRLGFEIIKVWEKKEERMRPLEEVKDNIKNSLLARKRNEKLREVLRELKKTAQVEKLITFEEPRRERPSANNPGGRIPMGRDGKVKLKHPRRPPPTEAVKEQAEE